jgi:hypothetical protein
MPSKSDTTDQLARAIGYALSSWATVELALDNLFSTISGMNKDKAHILMATIVSLETRVAVCNALMAVDDDLKDDFTLWTQVAGKVLKGYKARHQIAHFVLFGKGDPTEPGATVAPFFSTGNIILGKHSTLGVAEINHKKARFDELATAVNWFWVRKLTRRVSGLEGHELESDLIRRLRSQADQTPAKTPPPPESSEV